MEYTKEMILKLAKDLERCSNPMTRCIGCSFEDACGKDNGNAILTAAAAVIRWQSDLIEEYASAEAENAVRSLDCARDDKGAAEGLNKGQEWQMGLYERAIEKWGEKKQIKKAIEEMGELIVELSRWQLNDGAHDDHLLSHIKEELADVCIMTDQLQLIFGDVSDWEMHKLERLERKLERGL